jgi:hypothetical protein
MPRKERGEYKQLASSAKIPLLILLFGLFLKTPIMEDRDKYKKQTSYQR